MDPRTTLGRRGEHAAARLYESLGFSIVDRNYRCPEGEIDLVATKDGLLVFCEVKTRTRDVWGRPSEAVNRLKQLRLRKLAATWLSRRSSSSIEIRFDVVSVIVRGAGFEIVHIPDAF